jgi:hypothetical protein
MKFITLSSIYLASLMAMPVAVNSLSLRAVVDQATPAYAKCVVDCLHDYEDKCVKACNGDMDCGDDCIMYFANQDKSNPEYDDCTAKCGGSLSKN